MRELIVCSILLLVSVVTSSSAWGLLADRTVAQYGHRSWSVQDGFFNGQPVAVAQTADDYLWIAGADGLLRFDGVRFVPVKLPSNNASGTTDVTALLGTKDGSLWIGTVRGLMLLRDGEIILVPGLVGSVLQIIGDTQDAGVWLTRTDLPASQHEKALCHVVQLTAHCYGPAEGVISPVLRTAAVAGDGSLWLGASTGVQSWRPESHRTYTIPALRENLDMAGVQALAVTKNGSVWIGESSVGKEKGSGLEILTDGVLTPYATDRLKSRHQQQVVALLADRDGSLWAGTPDRGIFRLSNGRLERFRRTDGLSGDQVFTIFEGHDGTIWVLTNKGIDCFFSTPVVTFSTVQGLSADEVDSVAPSRDGVWLGTPKGISLLRSGFVSDVPVPGFGSTQATTIFDDGAGHVWAGVGHDLLAQAGGHIRRITGIDHHSLGFIAGIAGGNDGTAWVEVANPDRLLLHVSTGAVLASLPASVVPPAIPITSDNHGGLWLGAETGNLVHLVGTSVFTFPFPHAETDRIRQIRVLPDDTVFAAATFGLLSLRGGRQQLLSTANGLPCKSMRGVALDQRDDLWMTSECGIFELTATELKAWLDNSSVQVHPHVLLSTDGIQLNYSIFGPSARSPDGKIWFATGGELQMVDPMRLTEPEPPASPRVESVLVDLQDVSRAKKPQLPTNPHAIEIDYTSVNFTNPQDVVFRFRLVGHDTKWTDAGGRRQAFYNDLGPGKYTFEVAAGTRDGQWNQSTANLSFAVPPTFYQTIWFRVLLLVCLAMLLWSAYSWRLRLATEAVQGRFIERLAERGRIARELHDTLLQGFQGLLLRINAVHMQLGPDQAIDGVLKDILDRGDQILHEARVRVLDLRTKEVPSRSVYEALAETGGLLARSSTALFRCELSGDARQVKVVSQDQLIAIGREALANAFQHASAANVMLAMHFETGGLSVSISDDGCGIDREIQRNLSRPGHLGLVGMQERARTIGAELSVKSRANGGTTVHVFIPARLAYLP